MCAPRDQFPEDQWMHFCNGYLKFVYFLITGIIF